MSTKQDDHHVVHMNHRAELSGGRAGGDAYAWGLILSREGNILALTPAASEHWQSCASAASIGSSMIGSSVFDLLPESSRRVFLRVLESSAVWDGTFETCSTDVPCVMRGSLTPLLAGTGTNYWLLLAYALESSVAQLVSSVRMPCLFVDESGTIVEANRQICDLFGYNSGDLLGQPVHVLVPEMLRERHVEHFGRFAATTAMSVPMGGYGDLKGRRQDGSLIMFRASITRHDIDGRKGFLLVMEDVDQQERFRRMLRWNERHDTLTGMPNRQAILEHLETFLKNLPVADCRFSFMVFDIDHFEQINDVHGHLMGDEVLRIAAARINRHAGTNVRTARLASDEFCLVSDAETTLEQVQTRFERVRADLAKPIHLGGHSFCLSVSVGVVLVGRDQLTSHDILRAAKLAVRAAKANGGSCMKVYDDDLQHSNARYHAIRAALQGDTLLDTLSVVVQPIVVAANGAVAGAEVLLRWRLNDQAVSPAEFIPVAEQGEAIHIIGLWVLEQTCKLSRSLDDLLGGRAPYLSVNLSTRQLDDADLPDKFAAILRRYGARPSQIEIEVTETAMMTHLEDNLRTLNNLRDMGFRFSVDDFGTGHSSLAQLLRMPVDKLKVDKVFIDDMDLRPDNRSIVSASIKLAHGLKMQVVAEGVERDTQLQELQTMGCDLIQGYLFHKPMPVGEFMDVVRQQASRTGMCAEQIHYLIYTSKAVDGLDDAKLDALLAEVAPLNKLRGITGCLLAQGTVFMQMLEGPRETILDTYARIARDQRHAHLQVIDEGVKSGRTFTDWSMRIRRLDANAEQNDRLVSDSILPRANLSELAQNPRSCYAFLCAHAEDIASLSD